MPIAAEKRAIAFALDAIGDLIPITCPCFLVKPSAAASEMPETASDFESRCATALCSTFVAAVARMSVKKAFAAARSAGRATRAKCSSPFFRALPFAVVP